jgi:hypothetical protein
MIRHAKVAGLMIALSIMAGEFILPAKAELSFSFFYSNLSQHGSWLVSAQNGRVWQPGVYAPGWNPYYDGHWVYSDLGWSWVSDYDWGGIPYHYGTWVEDPTLGWVWVPGYVWAPSWVVFRTGPDYIGWAPVPPAYSVGAGFDAGRNGFVFVSSANFLAPSIRAYVVPERATRVIVNNTRVVNTIMVQNNVIVNRGPDVGFIEKASGRKITPTPIEDVRRAGPGPRFSRSEVQLAEGRSARGLRVASPYPATAMLPSGREAAKPAAPHAASGTPEAGSHRASPERGGRKSHAERPSPERREPVAGSSPAPAPQGGAANGTGRPEEGHKRPAQPHKEGHKSRPAQQRPEGDGAGSGAGHHGDGSDGDRT